MSSKVIQKISDQPKILIMLLSILCFGFIITQQAWLTDDSLITLRVVQNFHDGYGLRWNIAERVQVYTHPLWMFLLSIVTFITQEYIYTTLIFSLVLSLLSFSLIWKLAATTTLAVIASFILIASQSYIDYATSGLENPLSHLILILLVYCYLFYREHRFYFLYLGILTSFLLLSRLDLLLLIFPLGIWELWQLRSKRAFFLFALGLSPLVAWELFSLVYYGFPVPNTAYSKINPSSSEPRFYNGLRYYLFSLQFDAITLLGITTGGIVAYITRKPLHIFLSLGMALYLIYWIYVGGDYMGGRSFSAVLCVSILIIITSNLELNGRQVLLIIALMIMLFNINSIFHFIDSRSSSYITNERDYYKKDLALSFLIQHQDTMQLESRYYTNEVKEKTVFTFSAVGALGFFGGPKLHVIDTIGLGDALIARLPPLYTPYPRPGHFLRGVPMGYEETWETGTNQITDPELAQFYDHLAVITQGPLWSWERWKTVWNMNTGAYDHLIDQDRYTFYHLYQMPATATQTMQQPIETKHGIQVDFDELNRHMYTQVKLDSTTRWRIIWYRDNQPVGQITIPADGYPHAQVQTHHLTTPPEAQQLGFNSVRLLVENQPESFISSEVFLFQGLTTTDQISELAPILELRAGWLSLEKERVAPQINFVSSSSFEILLPTSQTIQLAFTPITIRQYPTSTTTQTGTVQIQTDGFTSTLPISVNQETVVSIPLTAGIHYIETIFDGYFPNYSAVDVPPTHLYTRVQLVNIHLLGQ